MNQFSNEEVLNREKFLTPGVWLSEMGQAFSYCRKHGIISDNILFSLALLVENEIKLSNGSAMNAGRVKDYWNEFQAALNALDPCRKTLLMKAYKYIQAQVNLSGGAFGACAVLMSSIEPIERPDGEVRETVMKVRQIYDKRRFQ